MKKYLYRQVIRWKKNPKNDYLLGGSMFLITALLLIGLLFGENSQVALLTLIFSGMAFFGARLILKGCGEGKRIYYEKTKLKDYKKWKLKKKHN